MKLGLDEVDALTGGLVGRPKSATFRTMDVVGLDTMQHVVETMQQQLKKDPWHPYFALPDWLNNLIKQGHLGQKAGQGIYRKNGKVIEVFDIKTGHYREAKGSVSDEVKTIMKITDARERMSRLSASSNPQAKFLVACFRDLFHYCAFHLADIANTVRDVDLAIRRGFGWAQGPFETWQQSGVEDMTRLVEEAITTKESMSNAPLPNWLKATHEFYRKDGAFSSCPSRVYRAQ